MNTKEILAAIALLALPFISDAQFDYDARILEYTGLKYACEGSGTPVLKIQNVGTQAMGTCVVETWKNGIMVNSFNWVLAVPAVEGEVRQPALPVVPTLEFADDLEFRIISVNGEPDQDATGNILAVAMDEVPSLSQGGDMQVKLSLGDAPGSIEWTIKNALNQVVASGGPYETANTEIMDDVSLPAGCYSFKAEDITRSVAPDAVVTVEQGGNVLLAAADLSSPYSGGLKSGASGSCANPLSLELTTDGSGSEVAWELLSEDGWQRMCASAPYADAAQVIASTCCLPDGCYRLRVTDAGGDGIAGGGYVLREGAGAARRIIDNSGNFTNGSVSAIANGLGFCLPMGADRMTTGSCDKLDWRTAPCNAEYVVVNDNPAVNAEYGISNASSGYQLWWFDPNGGYSLRRYQSHSASNGMPAGPTRACHFRINAWSGNQLQEGTLYNMRARGRVAGSFLEWGPACRFRIDNTAAQCPTAQLLNDPSNPFMSCGATRTIGTGTASLVHATPVRRLRPNCSWQNANRYEFRFRHGPSAFELVKSSSGYFVNTMGLSCGLTYAVDVRASFDNGATWCADGDAWGASCELSIAPCAIGPSGQYGPAVSAVTESRLYPNPNRGDQLFISLSSVEEGVSTVSVDIYDGFGKRVAARTIAVQDGFVNTVLDLNGDLATGLYVVNITAGAQVHTERLLIQP